MWCALFYFIKCKANTVSAKSVQSSSLESQITGFLLYVYIQYIHKILPSNFLAASLSTVMTSRRQLEYHIGTAQPPNWRHWQIVCTTSMAVLCECEKFRHRKCYVRVLTDNQEKRPLHFGLKNFGFRKLLFFILRFIKSKFFEKAILICIYLVFGILLANRVFYCYKEIKHFSPLGDSECWFLAGYIPTINHFERMIVAQCILHRKSTPKNNDAQSAIITVVIVILRQSILVILFVI